jgi:hypothetical protein
MVLFLANYLFFSLNATSLHPSHG